MTALPGSFYAKIAAGTRALLTEENRLRKLSCNGDPRVLLDLRGVTVLRERMEHARREDWENGMAVLYFAPQDLGVLIELEERYANSPYRDASVLRDLREALEWYQEQDIDFTRSTPAND